MPYRTADSGVAETLGAACFSEPSSIRPLSTQREVEGQGLGKRHFANSILSRVQTI